jgi:predicted DNA-binding protein
MSNPEGAPGKAGVKTLAIRLEPELHAQLSFITQLKGSTIADEMREAIEAHVVTMKANPDLAAKAAGVLEEIEREAALRRAAIATLFGSEAPPEPGSSTGRSRSPKQGNPA